MMMMRLIRNEKGVALVMVTIIALIGLAMVSTLLFMVTQGTRISGFQRVFRSTDEAGLGGAQIATQVIMDNIFNAKQAPPLPLVKILNLNSMVLDKTDACLIQKLTLSRGKWDTTDPNYFWPACTGNRAMAIDADKMPDFTFETNPGLVDPNAPNFMVYAKILDTVKGNTEESGLRTGKLGGRGVVSSQEGEITPAPAPTLYRIEIQAQDKTNPQQRSKYSVLYGY